MTVTFTPGRIPPELSRTTPYRVAVVTWANALADGSTSVATATSAMARARESCVISDLNSGFENLFFYHQISALSSKVMWEAGCRSRSGLRWL